VKTVGQKEDVSAARKGERAIYFKEFEDYSKTPIYERDLIPTGCTLEGPVIVEEMDTTTVIPPGWTMDRDKSGNLIMHRGS
jgi:N-methylhydantoinase A